MRLELQALGSVLRSSAGALIQGALLGVLIVAAVYPSSLQTGHLVTARAGLSQRFANFGATQPSAQARTVADWVAAADDNRGLSFVIVDKTAARVYVFDARARLLASSPVLLGSALGDGSAPGIGDKPIEQVQPHERTTPAGRFVAQRGRNARGEDVVWVDYGAAVSMHRVLTTDPAERRIQRLASPTADDNRISYGCINVPVPFYETFIRPAFALQPGIVYVLPDLAPVEQVFGIAAGAARTLQQAGVSQRS